MAVTYEPFKGNAGVVKISLQQYKSQGVAVVPEYFNHIYLHVVDFQESMEESELNAVYEDINGNLSKNHFGYRQVVSFSVVNSERIPVVSGMTKSNRRAIQELIIMINKVNKEPKSYRLVLQYRDNPSYSVIYDAVFTSSMVSLSEFKNDANIAQIIKMEFKSRYVSEPDFGLDIDSLPLIVLETAIGGGTNTVLIREESTVGNEIPIILQTNQYSLTP